MGSFLRNGAYAADGLLTEAPPNTGAGWYSLATGAWPGVHGSTNNTFHINGAPFGNRTAAFDAGVLQAETMAQTAERGGKKVAQVEWAGGRNARSTARRSTTGASSPGVASRPTTSALPTTPPSSPPSACSSTTRQALPGRRLSPGAAPTDAAGWTNTPSSFSPAKEMRLRVLDAGVDKYGLNAYMFDSTNDGQVKYDRVLFSPTKDGRDGVGTLSAGQVGGRQGQDRRRRAGWQDRRDAGQGRRVAPAICPRFACSTPPSPAPTRPGLPGPASPALPVTSPSTSPRSSRPPPRPISPSSRRASSARRPTSNRACTGRPGISRSSST